MDNRLKSKKELEMVGRKNENIEQETNDYNAWTYDFSDAKTPSSMMYGGKANAGKVLTCNGDGYIVLLPAQGGEGGYEPDDETIGLNADLELYVKDYASKTYVDGLDDSIRQWVEDTFCLESFAVELDERLEVVEEDLTEINPIVARALLTPVATPTSKELVGVNTNKEQIRITLGSGLTLSDSNVLSANGGGGDAEPVYVITGTATITDPTSLKDIPINITSTNIYNELATFFNINNRLPRIIMNLSLSYEGTIISNIFLDLIANAVEQNEFSLAGSSNDLSSSGISVSYVDIKIKTTEQTGLLTATPLQTRLDSDSEIEVKKIKFDNYYIDKPSLSALLTNVNRLVEKELPEFVNDKYLKVVNGALSWEDAGGSGGSKYYLHTVSFDTDSGNMHWQIGALTKNSTTYTSLDAFWNDVRKIITIFGTPNQASSTKEIYFNGALGDGDILVRGVDSNFDVVVDTINKSSVDLGTFADWGVEEL